MFEAAVLREMERIEAAQGVGTATEAPLADRLRAFGISIMSFLATEPAIGFYNALSAELRRHPNLSRAFWELGPGRTRRNLSRILAAAAARGEIAIGEPEHAADMLFGMWQGFTNLQLALAIGKDEARASTIGRVDRGVATFLKAFAADVPAPDKA